MARSWTLAQLRDRAKSESDMINNIFVTDAEWQDWINSNLCEVYDLLVQAGPPDYYSTSVQFNTSAGVLSYALPNDFRSATCLYGVIEADRRVPVREINDYERARFIPPQAVYTMELEYVPVPPLLTSDVDTFDGVSGWEELIVSMSARDALLKEESDVSAMMDRIERLKGRIRTASSQRGAGPRYITDVSMTNAYGFSAGNAMQIRGCRIRADNIELYQPQTMYWWT